jgi:signal transduction histidine kinase
MISHEYRTPLSVISTNLDILQLKAKNSAPEIQPNLQKMTRATGKLADIDPALIMTPPEGLEIGYVPIVTQQGLE